jgi:Transposase DDE domain group 1
MLAQDLTCWTQALLLDGPLALAEPKTLRYWLLHVAARIVHHARRVILRLQRSWPLGGRACPRVRAVTCPPAALLTIPDTGDPLSPIRADQGRPGQPPTTPSPLPARSRPPSTRPGAFGRAHRHPEVPTRPPKTPHSHHEAAS